MRLDKILANSGFGSRKEVKQLLKSGKIHVNDIPVKDGKEHVDPTKDILTYDHKPIHYREWIYIMMNKPKGYISATEDKHDKTVIDLLNETEAAFAPFPVGRLDKDTTGLLLLTNDGKLAHDLTSPRKKVDKQYEVILDHSISEEDIKEIEQGIELEDGYITKPAQIERVADHLIETKEFKITIQEGKYHQVKRMFGARGRRVMELKRIRMGQLKLDKSLPLGAYRELSEEELQYLKIRS